MTQKSAVMLNIWTQCSTRAPFTAVSRTAWLLDLR